MPRKPQQPPDERRKIHPKVRMIENGSLAVNSVRAEFSAAVAVMKPKRKRVRAAANVVEIEKRDAKVKSLGRVSDDVLVNLFVHTTNGKAIPTAKGDEKMQSTCTRGPLRTMTLPLSKVRKLARSKNVTHLELGEPLSAPAPIVVPGKPGEPKVDDRIFGDRKLRNLHKFGEDVLIGIIDVQGFDFAHPDFLDRNGRTRFYSIWDQGATGGKHPKGSEFSPDYGHELTRDAMNAAIAASKKQKLPATALEPQSQMVPGSHGTHVASIAAGNRGICRNATIVGVLIALPQADVDPRRSFYDSTRIAHAVDYLVELSKKLRLRLAINVSLGTNGHAHDASSAISRWLDNAMATPGRCIAVAAGNAGQERATFEGDLGYVSGRIHTSGRIPASGLNREIEWLVVGDGRWDVSENELEIWYSPQDRFEVQVRPPGGSWTRRVLPGEYLENHQLVDSTFISIYSELYHPSNGANYISIYLSPFMSPDGVIGIEPGVWTIRLIGTEVRDGRYHGWIERDDPRPAGRSGDRTLWHFPSYFSEKSNVDESSVSSLACGLRVLAVANLDIARETINITSSQGPTRDGRFKPDVAAPGTNIVAARGFGGPNDLWVKMTGTSMASPFVCGVAGLMLQIEPNLTAAQIEGIVQRTALPLPGGSFAWINNAGFGRIDPAGCLREAATINQRKELPP